jgi:hypothetical protein
LRFQMITVAQWPSRCLLADRDEMAALSPAAVSDLVLRLILLLTLLLAGSLVGRVPAAGVG